MMKLPLRALLMAGLLVLFYRVGFPLTVVFVLGLLFLFVLLVRGPIKRKVEKTITMVFPFTNNWPDWARALLVFVVFIIVYSIIKFVLFEVLKVFGIDVQKMIADAANQSLNK